MALYYCDRILSKHSVRVEKMIVIEFKIFLHSFDIVNFK